ncbi:hypothetical protein ABPG75_005625 [Micractinium tetrahymenae]
MEGVQSLPPELLGSVIEAAGRESGWVAAGHPTWVDMGVDHERCSEPRHCPTARFTAAGASTTPPPPPPHRSCLCSPHWSFLNCSCAVALTCKQWRRALYERASAIWRHLQIRTPDVLPPAGWLVGKRRLLGRVSAHVQEALLEGRVLELVQLLPCLQPAALLRLTLRLQQLPPDAARQIGQLSRLQALGVATAHGDPCSTLLPVLHRCPQLCKLRLEVPTIAPDGPAALAAAAPRLTSLVLKIRHNGPAGPLALGPLTTLRALMELGFALLPRGAEGGPLSQPLRLLPASAFPALTRLALRAPRLQTPAGPVVNAAAMPVHPVAALANPAEGPPAAVQLWHAPSGGGGWQLECGALELGAPPSGAALGHVIAGLGVCPQQLQRLVLSRCSLHLAGAALGACGAAQLGAVTRLTVEQPGRDTTPPSRMPSGLPRLLGMLPSLRAVHLMGPSAAVPGVLLRLPTSLHSLQLHGCALKSLPDLRCLEGLTSLVLDADLLRSPALLAATRLETLHLTEPLSIFPTASLYKIAIIPPANVHDVLARLPALRTLHVHGMLQHGSAACLAECLPRLRVEVVAAGPSLGARHSLSWVAEA